MIRSVGLWQLDGQGLPRPRGAWSRATTPAAQVTALPVWPRPGLVDRPYDAVVAAWPVAAGHATTTTLVVLECSASPIRPAAVEHWGPAVRDDMALALHDGWYTDAALPMTTLSRHSPIRLGFGLPGLAAQLGSPVYLGNLGTSELFAWASTATQVELRHGLALPAPDGRGALVLQCGDDMGLATRVELAAVEPEGLRSLVGHCQHQGPLMATAPVQPWGASLLQACAASGEPLLVTPGQGWTDGDAALQALGAGALLALPFSGSDGLQVVLALWL